MIRYEEKKLVQELERLPRRLRTVFAAACAERLLPAYRRFEKRSRRGDSKELATILKRLWDDLEGTSMTSEEVEAMIAKCMTLIPREDEGPWIEEQAAAEDAGAAVAYALRCRKSGESQEAAWAARRCYEALDHFVVNRDNIDTNAPGAEERIFGDPLVQAELLRQQRDLDDLMNAGIENAVTMIHLRAKDEAPLFFSMCFSC
jgi:uncharacterized protein YjaG (DUF416 family)